MTAGHFSKTELIAQKLLQQIVDGGLQPGETLGTEAALLERYGVSRPTLRESLRMLEMQGAIQMRPGPKAGIVVSRPTDERLAHLLSVFLYLRQVPFSALLEARALIEPALAFEAAVRGTEADFAAMEASVERMRALDGTHESFVEENRTFHDLTARASGNEVLEMFWGAIALMASGEQHGVRFTRQNQAHVVKAHEAILRACRARDGDRAAKATVRHIQDLEELLLRRHKALLKQPVNITTMAGRPVVRDPVRV